MKKILCLLLVFNCCNCFAQEKFTLLVGTYTSDSSKGIYVYEVDEASYKIKQLGFTPAVNPSFLSISSDQKNVYSVNVKGPDDKTGRISSFAYDADKAALNFLSTQPSPGDNPCYITTHPSGRWVVAGNYDNGTIGVYPVNGSGVLQPASDTKKHTGHSADTTRQNEAHVHCTVFSPDGKYLFVPDLGIDKVMIYRFDERSGKLFPGSQPFVQADPGSGPRHISFDPNGKYAYLIEELAGNIIVYGYDKKNGKLKEVQKISNVPADFTGAAASADIHISPDGKFLYATNRGESNSISIFKINTETGKLSLSGHQPVLGKTPRNFVISNDGNFLLVANQNSDTIVLFKRNKDTGMLTDTGERIHVSKPVCLKIPLTPGLLQK